MYGSFQEEEMAKRLASYYNMDLSPFPRLNEKTVRFDHGFSYIEVPQACFGVAEGPAGENQELRFLTTMGAPCVAVAFVGVKKTGPAKYPTVVLVHFDDAGLEYDEIVWPMRRTEGVIAYCEKYLKLRNLHAHVVNGDENMPLLGSIITDLKEKRIPFDLEVGCCSETLTIDLVDGAPVSAQSLRGLAKYKGEPELDMLVQSIVFGQRRTQVAPLIDLRLPLSDVWTRQGSYPSAPVEYLLAQEQAAMCFDRPPLVSMTLSKDKAPRETKAVEPTRPSETELTRARIVNGKVQIPVVPIEKWTLGV